VQESHSLHRFFIPVLKGVAPLNILNTIIWKRFWNLYVSDSPNQVDNTCYNTVCALCASPLLLDTNDPATLLLSVREQ